MALEHNYVFLERIVNGTAVFLSKLTLGAGVDSESLFGGLGLCEAQLHGFSHGVAFSCRVPMFWWGTW